MESGEQSRHKMNFQTYFTNIFDEIQKPEPLTTTTAGFSDEDIQLISYLFQPNVVDLPKFFSQYQNYKTDQHELRHNWLKLKNDKFICKELKKNHFQTLIAALKSQIRFGIPYHQWRTVLLPLFENSLHRIEDDYRIALNVTFNWKVPDSFKNVPLFCHSNDPDEVLAPNFLTYQGLEPFKRIMWIFEKNVMGLEYNPMLSHCVALLLLHFKEAETYCVVKAMLDRSKAPVDAFFKRMRQTGEIQRPNWFFTLKKDDYISGLDLIAMYIEFRGQGFSKIRRHFKKIKYDLKKFCDATFKTLFLRFLPLSIVLKLFCAFLSEGLGVYYRFTLALLKVFMKEILACEDPKAILAKIKQEGTGINEKKTKELFKEAYELKLQDPHRKVPDIPFIDPLQIQDGSKLYFPQLSDESSLVTTQHFETIWEWLPSELKLSRPVLAYSSKMHGWSLQTLYKNCKQDELCRGMLLLIRSNDFVAFGAFVDTVFMPHKGGQSSIGSHDCFVFQLEPKERVYKSTRKNQVHLVCDTSSLSMGAGGGGAALYLDSDLFHGFSNKCETYGSEPLNEGDGDLRGKFESRIIEVYWIK